MFISERMNKIDVMVLKRDIDNVSKEIIKFGDYQLIELKNEKTDNQYDYDLNSLLDLERRLNYLYGYFKDNLFLESIEYDEQKSNEVIFLDKTEIEKKVTEIENEIKNYNKKMEELSEKKVNFEIKIKKINYFSKLNINPEDFNNLKSVCVFFGVISKNNFLGFEQGIKEIEDHITYKILDTENDEYLLIIINSFKYKDNVESILKNVFYKNYGVDLDADFKNKLFLNSFELTTIHDEELWLEKDFAKKTKKNIPLIKLYKNSMKYLLTVSKLKNSSDQTDKIFLLSGWVPSKVTGKLKNKIENITKNNFVFIEKDADDLIEEGFTPPTKLNNPFFIKPFEMIVNGFGVPNYKELDPTFITAVCYVAMYGAMFGDIGHGIILTCIGLLLKLFKKFKPISSLTSIIVTVGLSSVIFGFLYGEIFGIGNIFKPIWMSPGHHIMDILLIAIFFGISLISIGIIINIVNCIRMKKYGKLLFTATGLAGLSFYWGAIIIVLLSINKHNPPIILYLFPVYGIVSILFEKKLEHLFFGKKRPHENSESKKFSLIDSFFELFDALLSFLTNTVSFMRVGAFALNHSALMGVVYLLAGDPEKTNFIAYSITIVIGNLFVICFEGFIVGIQTLRLEYYEFFTKFFKSGGTVFHKISIHKNS